MREEREEEERGSHNDGNINDNTLCRKSTRQAIVVLGEASESDDEDDEILTDHSSVVHVDDVIVRSSAIVVHDNAVASSKPETKTKLQLNKNIQQGTTHNSLLHRKLKERNIALREHIVQGCKQPYQSAARDLISMTQLLVKSQSSVQETCTIVRQVTNDVFHLDDKLDIAIDCGRLIPDIDIRIPTKTPRSLS